MDKRSEWRSLTDLADDLVQSAFAIRKSEGCKEAFDVFQSRIGDAVKDFHDVVFAVENMKEKR